MARTGPGARLLSSRARRAVDVARRFAATSVRSIREPDRFRDVESLCLFIGHVKSGGTLLGAMLDAHPEAVVADEIDVLRYVAAGFRRDQIFHLLVKGSRREAIKGRVTARRLQPYSVAVPGQWQGRHRTLRVIGESRAGPTTRRLGRDPALLDRLTDRIGAVRLRFVHVIRHPLDPIAAMVLRSGRSIADAIEDHAGQCRTLVRLRDRIDPEGLLTVRYETLVDDPVATLRGASRFLGLSTDEEHVAACAGIVDRSVEGERRRIRWAAEHLDAVLRTVARTPFLEGYEIRADAKGRAW